MAFGTMFDGYCVIHAPFACPERRPWFEAELRRVGVERMTVIEARRIEDGDTRLAAFGGANALLSLIEALQSALRFARASRWRSVVVMEDDVKFRRRFTGYWAEVEEDVRRSDWDILNLYRTPVDELLLVEPRGRTHLVRVMDAIGCFCSVFRETIYEQVIDSWEHCVRTGWPADFYYGYCTRKYGARLFATSRNLAGQAWKFRSTLRGVARWPPYYAEFRACGTPLEGAVVGAAYSVVRQMRRLFRRSAQ